MANHNIKEGMVTEFRKITSSKDAYTSTGQITLDFLVSTPAIVTMIIEASAKMLDDLVLNDDVTIGSHIELSHEHATLIGEEVIIKIKVAKIEGNTIYLEFEGRDADGIFCRGKYQRHIVHRQKLMEAAYARFDRVKIRPR